MTDKEMLPAKTSRSLVFSALITVQVLFGINYVASKIVVESFPPLVWSSLRMVIASIMVLVIALLTRRKHPPLSKAYFLPMIVYALLGTIINQATFLVGLHYTTSTNSAILNTLIPIFTLMVVTLRGQEPLTLQRTVGFCISLLGVLTIHKAEEFSLSNQTALGDLLTIINCLSYALFLAYSKKFFETYDAIWTTTWLFIYGSIGLTLIAIPQWGTFHWPEMTPILWGTTIFAVIGATFLTYFLNFWALAHAKSSHVALFIYLQPIVTSFIAWYWFGEFLTLRTILASVLIFSGLLFAL